MKVIISLLLISISLIACEPPRSFFNRPRQNFGFFQRQEQPQAATNGNNNGDAAPYPPSGYRPPGAEFRLPARQQDSNGYQYGPPPELTTNTDESATEATTPAPDAENIKSGKQQLESLIKNTDRGFYYVYHPDGRLQRVVYMTSADLQNMAYSAQVKYEDVDPVSAPIYAVVQSDEAGKKPITETAASAEKIIIREVQDSNSGPIYKIYTVVPMNEAAKLVEKQILIRI